MTARDEAVAALAEARGAGGQQLDAILANPEYRAALLAVLLPVEDLAAARYARAVATAWRDEVMASETLRGTGMSHPLAMVLAAFDGETEARELGLSDDALRAALAAHDTEAGSDE